MSQVENMDTGAPGAGGNTGINKRPPSDGTIDPTPNSKRQLVENPQTDTIRVEVSKVIQRFPAHAIGSSLRSKL